MGAASPLPLPPPSPPLLLPFTDRRADIPKVVLPPQKRLCIAPGPRFEVGESSSAAATRPTGGYRADYGFIGTLDAELRRDRVREMGYEIIDVWEDLTEATEEVPPTSVAELSQRVTDLITTIRQDTNEIYVRFEDAQDDRGLLIGQVNMLHRDRQYHLSTSMLVESEAKVARGAWAQSIGCSRAVHDELQAYQTHTQIQDTHISSLEVLVTTLLSHTTSLQTQLIAALGRIDTLEARDPAHTNDPEDVDSCRVANALAEIEANRTSRNGDDGHDSRTGSRRTERDARLTQWFKKMESVFHISNCTVACHIKFATCTLLRNALTWWNSHIRTGRAYTAGPSEKKEYGGSRPKCSKCNYHHNGPCAPKCHKCNKVGHLACDCRIFGNANTGNNQRENQKGTSCYECGTQGNFKREYPNLKNKNYGNQGGNGNAPAKVSFVSTAFCSLIDITPTTLDHYYDVELADGKIIRINTIIRGCTLNFLNHPLNIDLIPVEL
ncbi:putative reverse transcriptase domain-containing protein, partial [Tanacetum coccineum]